MEKMILGRTGLEISRTGFGCIPIQRISYDESTRLLRRAYDAGITFFDTANAYTTSEERIGIALSEHRRDIVIATKSVAKAPEKFMANIEKSLKMMKTDYLDILQVHNPEFVPRPQEENGIYDALLLAKKQGKIRHIGISFHRLDLAVEAVKSGLYDTMQYPFSYLSSPEEIELVRLCDEHNVGFIAMKGLAGGLLSNAEAAFAFMRQYKNVAPIWGIQHMEELEEFLRYGESPPALDEKMQADINSDIDELGTEFCRGCGYCLPCPADIPIPFAVRITFFMKRFRMEPYLTEKWRANFDKINNCTECGHCKKHCPYKLDVPNNLKVQLEGYNKLYDEYIANGLNTNLQ